MIYQIFVQSFYDSNGDGTGDLNGVKDRLDYLQNLGMEGIWLMPIHPSPSYHKYDVTDYYQIHPDYGTIEDLKTLIEAAHDRGMIVIIDLVVSHCSSAHPWFRNAIINPDGAFRNYFIWATDDRIEHMKNGAKAISSDSDNIDQWNEVPDQKEKYYAYFWSGMPDLNFDTDAVKREVFRIGRYWLEEVGVDGFRLDAANHIYPDNRASANHQFWAEFRSEMEQVNPDVFLVGEIWDKATVAAPYLKGLKSVFNFELGYAITDAIQKGDATGLAKTYKGINRSYQTVTSEYTDSIFIKNHDQERILSALKNDPNRAKMAAALLLTLPGTPFLYYGEEIGMKGKKPDIYIREPFLWSESDPGQTTWMAPRYSVSPGVQPLNRQMADPTSFYNHYKRLIAFRKQNEVMSIGTIEFIEHYQKGICAFKRIHKKQHLKIYHNLSAGAISTRMVKPVIRFQTGAVHMDEKTITIPAYTTIIVT